MIFSVSRIVIDRLHLGNVVHFNPLPSLTLQSARDLNVPCRPKRSEALLLSYTFKRPLKKKPSLSAHAVGL
jgi:hypothetical protein